MAIEAQRGCGYRRVGGLYLVGTGRAASCDRGLLPIVPCSVCGEHPRPTRGYQRINPLRLWGLHTSCSDTTACPTCYPENRGFLMWVGEEHYTMESFVAEAQRLGVSKRIAELPADFRIGHDWVYLAHRKAIPPSTGPSEQAHFDFLQTTPWHPRRKHDPRKPGVFYAFRPTRVEYICKESERTDEELQTRLRERGVTPIFVPDDDPDHQPKKRKRGGTDEETAS